MIQMNFEKNTGNVLAAWAGFMFVEIALLVWLGAIAVMRWDTSDLLGRSGLVIWGCIFCIAISAQARMIRLLVEEYHRPGTIRRLTAACPAQDNAQAI